MALLGQMAADYFTTLVLYFFYVACRLPLISTKLG